MGTISARMIQQGSAININRDTNFKSIFQQGHKLLIYLCQTNGDKLLSYRYQSEAHNYQCQTNGNDPQPVYQKQYGVSLSTNVFKVYMSQVKINRRIYNFYVVIYIT